jgi:hypothetical protein
MTSIIKVDQIQNAAGDAVMSFDGNGDVTFNGANTVTPVDSGWITPTLNSGYTNYSSPYGPVKYRKIGNIVNIQGIISNAAVGVVFTLPVGFRPDRQLIFYPAVNGGGASRLDIRQNGDVFIDTTSTSSWYSFACTFFTA